MVTAYDAIVVGAGPGGLSSTAALLDTGMREVLWVDRDFTGGRLNTLYREISSYVTPYFCFTTADLKKHKDGDISRCSPSVQDL